jgi:hypothetical protein
MTDHEPPADARGDAEFDSDVPWTDLSDGDAANGDGRAADGPPQVIAGRTALIEPAAYCRQCPHFEGDEAGCANTETRILEVLHDGRFHVIDCPVVTADGPAFDRGQRD